MKQTIRVLIVDDSALVRQTLRDVLSSDPQIEVIATASDPFVAAEKMQIEAPDVITLDIHMPRMDGITFLEKLLSQHPIPVVICSTLTADNPELMLKALERGAVEVIHKPKVDTKRAIEESRMRLCDAVKAAAQAHIQRLPQQPKTSPKLSADAVIAKARTVARQETTEKVVMIGASTGGTDALRVLLAALPANAPGIAIVQHMPEHFTATFARRLDDICRISVQEAKDGDTLIRGRALIAPGNRHLLLRRSGSRYFVEVRDGPFVCRHRPSVDVLFRSAARYAGKNCVGVIMTGMGDDGARGMEELKEAGAITLAQDEQSCVVYGMPHEAVKRGAVDKELPLEDIAPELVKIFQG
jgi:two-component system chemotaxis response regulator CheB